MKHNRFAVSCNILEIAADSSQFRLVIVRLVRFCVFVSRFFAVGVFEGQRNRRKSSAGMITSHRLQMISHYCCRSAAAINCLRVLIRVLLVGRSCLLFFLQVSIIPRKKLISLNLLCKFEWSYVFCINYSHTKLVLVIFFKHVLFRCTLSI